MYTEGRKSGKEKREGRKDDQLSLELHPPSLLVQPESHKIERCRFDECIGEGEMNVL